LPGQPAGSAGLHRVMAFSIFSSTQSGSSPGLATSQATRRVEPGFKTMAQTVSDDYDFANNSPTARDSSFYLTAMPFLDLIVGKG